MEFRNRGIICMLLLIILWILIYRSRIIDDIEGFDSNNDTINGLKFKSIVINLDKDQIQIIPKDFDYIHLSVIFYWNFFRLKRMM